MIKIVQPLNNNVAGSYTFCDKANEGKSGA